jgi:hypothetical protein
MSMQRRLGESGNGARTILMRYWPVILVAGGLAFESGAAHRAIAGNEKQIDMLKAKQIKLETLYIEAVKTQAEIKGQLQIIIRHVVPPAGNGR